MWSSLKRFWLFDDPRSYGARAILNGAVKGLRKIGKEVRLFKYDPQLDNPSSLLREDLLNYKPDAVLLANHPSSLFLSQIGLGSPPCQFFIWVFDDPYMMGAEKYSDEEIVLLADPGFISGARMRGASQIYFLPVAAPVSSNAQYKKEYNAPLAYVGSTLNLNQLRSKIQPQMAEYFDFIVKKKIEDPANSFSYYLNNYPISNEKKVTLTGHLLYYLYTEANRITRLSFLKVLSSSIDIQFYGNDAWLPLIQNTKLERFFHGTIDPFEDYSHLIRSVDINVNLRSLQGFVAPTQRDFLVPRHGGFLMSTAINQEFYDWSYIDPEDLFGLPSFPWSPSFPTPDLFTEAAELYLSDGRFRRDWVDYVLTELMRRHLFSHRMEQLGIMLSKKQKYQI